MTLVAIALGGALGSVLRYGLALQVHQWLGRGFPYGTLAVNVSGCLAIGLLYVLLTERYAVAPEWRAALLIGVLGGFTTFSTFSLETLALVDGREYGKALANIMLSLVLCLLATWLGLALGRRL
ncbi:fluoride efflux transporter CrcB [Ectothiorhodospiraceae bacterium 2226]|nr:fluoride efflux transporter CrcB [Ectothiorhodospiraceae bacterium 2226]